MEADIARWKRVVGDGLRSQTDQRQDTEVAIAANVLNRMLGLGRPEYVRIAVTRNEGRAQYVRMDHPCNTLSRERKSAASRSTLVEVRRA